jgi:hypothetical protein
MKTPATIQPCRQHFMPVEHINYKSLKTLHGKQLWCLISKTAVQQALYIGFITFQINRTKSVIFVQLFVDSSQSLSKTGPPTIQLTEVQYFIQSKLVISYAGVVEVMVQTAGLYIFESTNYVPLAKVCYCTAVYASDSPLLQWAIVLF